MRKYRRPPPPPPLSQINVTPFVDVMLILLLVFMITAPLLVTGVPIDLPEAQSSILEAPPSEPTIVSVTKEAKLFIGDEEIEDLETLTALLRQRKLQNPGLQLQLKGDRALNYGTVLRVMAAAAEAGVSDIALIASPENPTTLP